MAESNDIKLESFVQLQGLEKTPHLNGRIGIVIKDLDPSTQRFGVKLLEPWEDPKTGVAKADPISLKPQNLKLKYEHQTCQGCFKTFGLSELRKCSQCHMVRYCSEDCQKRDWKKVHKNDCKLLKSVRQSVRKDPEDDSTLPSDKSDRVFARQQRGMRHLQKGNIAAGEKEFRANIELEGFHTIGAYYNLASSLTMQNRNSEALVYVQKAVNLPVFGPEDRSCLLAAYSLLGTLQSGAGGNSQAAKEAYQKALELDPGNEEIKMYLNRV